MISLWNYAYFFLGFTDWEDLTLGELILQPEDIKGKWTFTSMYTRVYIRNLHQGYVNLPTLCQVMFHRSLNQLATRQNILLHYSINKSACKELVGQEVEDTLGTLVVFMYSRGWEINPKNIRDPSTSISIEVYNYLGHTGISSPFNRQII